MGSLQDSVQYVKGVGPARAKLLERMGIQTIEDVRADRQLERRREKRQRRKERLRGK
jgi:predicted RecB family nuclease